MLERLTRQLPAVGLIIIVAAAPAAAQRDGGKAPAANAPVLQEMASFATPSEATQFRATVARLRERLAKDAALSQRIEDAVAQGKNSVAETLLVEAGGVPTAKAKILSVARKAVRTSSMPARGAELFRLASSRFNPWWVKVTYTSKTTSFVWCYSSTGTGCA